MNNTFETGATNAISNDIVLTVINDGDGSQCGMTYAEKRIIMNNTISAIERVADRRHSRLYQAMPENIAARHVIDYLEHLKTVHKYNAQVLRYIESIKSGYEVQL